MSRTACLAAFVAIVAFIFVACTQSEGERCQQNEDCDSLLCVAPPGGSIGLGESGYCCDPCPTGERARWVTANDEDGEGGVDRCDCFRATTDGDADADQDAATDDGAVDGAVDGTADAATDVATDTSDADVDEMDGDGGPA